MQGRRGDLGKKKGEERRKGKELDEKGCGERNEEKRKQKKAKFIRFGEK